MSDSPAGRNEDGLTVRIDGRSTPLTRPDCRRAGGAVNAIEKASYLVEALRRLREDWALRYRHRYLSAPDVVPTGIVGGEWIVSHPARCSVECHVEFLPAQTDASGRGILARRDIEDWFASAARADPWLALHPPTVRWLSGEVPPAEVADDEPGRCLPNASASRVRVRQVVSPCGRWARSRLAASCSTRHGKAA